MSNRKQVTRTPTAEENFQSALNMVQSGWKPLSPELTTQAVAPEKKEESAGFLRSVGDIGVKLAQGAVDLGSSAVGLGSLATGGLVGKGMRAIGYDPKATNEMLGEYLSDSQKASDAKVAQADGFVDSLVAHIENPRSIVGGISQSMPGMLAGMGVTGAVARGLGMRAALQTSEGVAQLAAGKTATEAAKAALSTEAGKAAAQKALDASASKLITLGAATEGAQTAGKIADDAQAEGRDYSDYALPSLGAGLATAAIGKASGKLFGDSATELATGAATGVKGNFAKRFVKGFATEGLAEEAPQSYSEQVFTNLANGEEDLTKGASAAAGAGLAVGGFQGGGMAMLQRAHVPNTGSLANAANAGIDAQNQAAQVAAEQAQQQMPANQFNGLDPLIQAANGENPALARQLQQQVAIDDINTPIANDGSPQNFNELFAQNLAKNEAEKQQKAQSAQSLAVDNQRNSDDNQISWAEKSAPMPLEQAQHNNDEAKRRGIDTMIIPHLSGEGYTVVPKKWITPEDRAQFASLQQPFQAPIQAPIQENIAQEAPPIASEAVEGTPNASNELDAQLFDVDARVQGAQAEESKRARNALLDEFLQSPNLAKLKPDAIQRAFESMLEREGYYQTQAGLEEVDKIQRFTDLRDAEIEKPVIPVVRSTPNEMPEDLVKELKPVKKAEPSAQPAPPLPPELALLAQQSKNATEFFKGLNAAKIPVGSRAPLMAAFKALREKKAAKAPEIVAAIEELNASAHEAATSPLNDLAEPTDKQKEAGNYKKGHVKLHGLDISIENPQGSVRSGKDKDGKAWENTLPHHYGDITGTTGADGDAIDTFVGNDIDSDKVFVVDQIHPDTGEFDEHKVMLGFNSLEEAKAAYQASYAADWQGGKNITETTVEEFKGWLDSGKTKKPYAPIEQAKEHREVITPAKDESEQDRGNREWRENYDQVVNSGDLSTVNEKDLLRARSFAAQSISDQGRKGWDGSAVNQALIDSLKVEQDRIDSELERRTKVKDQKANTSNSDAVPPGLAKARELKAKREAVRAQEQQADYSGKWFGSQEKADKFIADKGIGDTHEVVKNDRRFEIKPKSTSVENIVPVIRPDGVSAEGAAWDAMTPEERHEIAIKVGWKNEDGTVSRAGQVFSKRDWTDHAGVTQNMLTKAIAEKLKPNAEAEAAQEAPKGLGAQLAELNNELERQGMVQNAHTVAKRDSIRKQIAEQDFPEIFEAVDGHLRVAEDLNRELQYAGDEPKAKTIERVLKKHGITPAYQKRWMDRLMEDQGNETKPVSAEAGATEAKGQLTESGRLVAEKTIESGNDVQGQRLTWSMDDKKLDEAKAKAKADVDLGEAAKSGNIDAINYFNALADFQTAFRNSAKEAMTANDDSRTKMRAKLAKESNNVADLRKVAEESIKAKRTAAVTPETIVNKEEPEIIKALREQTNVATSLIDQASDELIYQNDSSLADNLLRGYNSKVKRGMISPEAKEVKLSSDAASAPVAKTKKELAAEKVSSGLAELFAKLGDGTQAKMMPEQRRNLMPILTQVFEGAVEMGYESFKDAAKYVLGEMRKLGGNGFADQFNLGELKGAYNSLSPSEENEIAATKVRSIEEIDAHLLPTTSPSEVEEDAEKISASIVEDENPNENIDASDGEHGWREVGSLGAEDGSSINVSIRDIRDLNEAVRQIRLLHWNSNTVPSLWQWNANRIPDFLDINTAAYRYEISTQQDEAFNGIDLTDGDAVWSMYGDQIMGMVGRLASDEAKQIGNASSEAKAAPQNIPRKLSDINVNATVYDPETGVASIQEMPADQALKQVDDRIETLKSFLKCMGA